MIGESVIHGEIAQSLQEPYVRFVCEETKEELNQENNVIEASLSNSSQLHKNDNIIVEYHSKNGCTITKIRNLIFLQNQRKLDNLFSKQKESGSYFLALRNQSEMLPRLLREIGIGFFTVFPRDQGKMFPKLVCATLIKASG